MRKKPLPCVSAGHHSPLFALSAGHLGYSNISCTPEARRICELPLLPASRSKRQDPLSLGWTYFCSLDPASDEPANVVERSLVEEKYSSK